MSFYLVKLHYYITYSVIVSVHNLREVGFVLGDASCGSVSHATLLNYREGCSGLFLAKVCFSPACSRLYVMGFFFLFLISFYFPPNRRRRQKRNESSKRFNCDFTYVTFCSLTCTFFTHSHNIFSGL